MDHKNKDGRKKHMDLSQTGVSHTMTRILLKKIDEVKITQ